MQSVARSWLVLVLAFCLGLTTAFDNPARESFVVELVGVEHLQNAVTLYSTLVNLASVTIGGQVVGWFGEHLGPHWALGIGGLVAVCAVLLGWRSLVFS
jgi:MFS family permease